MVPLKSLCLFLLVVTLFALCNGGPPVSLPGDSWVNTMDRSFDFRCSAGQSISRLRSIHHNYYEDRVWAFSCQNQRDSVSRCHWTSYNGWDCPIDLMCPYNGFIAGVISYHDDGKEDRRYRFKCCDGKSYVHHCHWTSYKNGWDQELHYYVPRHYILRGVYSVHDNHREYVFALDQ